MKKKLLLGGLALIILSGATAGAFVGSGQPQSFKFDLNQPLPDHDGWIVQLNEEPEVKLPAGSPPARLNEQKENFKRKLASLGIKDNKVAAEHRYLVNATVLKITDQEAKKIKSAKLPEVKAIHPNYKVYAQLNESVPLIKADGVWLIKFQGQNVTGKGIRVGVIDTGIDYTHSDLGGCTVTQITASNCSKVKGGWDFVNNDNDPMDDQGHGTHVAATIAGNGKLKGVAPGAVLYAYKVLDASGSGTMSSVIAGIERATKDKMHIINLSLGGWGDPDDAASVAVDNAVAQGVIAVIAAGNSGPWENSIGSPGTSRRAITVAASDKNDKLASFSSRGPVNWINNNDEPKSLIKPDVTAPGVKICAAKSLQNKILGTDCLDGKHMSISGTSMATPHISGVAALLKQIYPSWTPDQVKSTLRSGQTNLAEPITFQGYGRINALATIKKSYPMVANLDNSQYGVGSSFDIKGTASANSFRNFQLYFTPKANFNLDTPVSEWQLLKTGLTQVFNNILLSGFDMLRLTEGENTFRLVVNNSSGLTTEDRILVSRTSVSLNSPQSYDIYRLGTPIEIRGTIKGKFESFKVEWAPTSPNPTWSSVGVVLAQNGTGPEIINGLIATLDTGALLEGTYQFRVVVNYTSGSTSRVENLISSVTLDKDLRNGWPQRIPYYRSSSSSQVLRLHQADQVFVPQDFLKSGSRYVAISGSEAKDYVEKLSQNLQASSYYYYYGGPFESVVNDLDRDGKKEIVVMRAGKPTEVWAYNSDGTIKWKQTLVDSDIPGGNSTYPVAADLNGDGYGEIIVPSINYLSNTSKIVVLDHNGQIVWSRPTAVPDWRFGIGAADLDRDGKKEVIVQGLNYGPNGPRMSVFDHLGNLRNSWSLPNRKVAIIGLKDSQPAFGNFDQDHDLEVVVSSHNEKIVNNLPANENLILVYNPDGSLVPGWPISLPGLGLTTPVVGDLDNDTKDDIVIGLVSSPNGFPNLSPLDVAGLWAIDGSGKVKPGWPFFPGSHFMATPALADLDGDKKLEIIASEERQNYTFVLNHEGHLLSGWPQMSNSRAIYSAIVADVNGDGLSDVLSSSDFGLEGWDRFGKKLPGFPEKTELVARAPSITDLDNDGQLELVMSSDLDQTDNSYKHRGSLYVWNLNVPKNQMPWPTFMHDQEHTGNYHLYRAATNTPTTTTSTIVITSTVSGMTRGSQYTLTWEDSKADTQYNILLRSTSGGQYPIQWMATTTMREKGIHAYNWTVGALADGTQAPLGTYYFAVCPAYTGSKCGLSSSFRMVSEEVGRLMLKDQLALVLESLNKIWTALRK